MLGGLGKGECTRQRAAGKASAAARKRAKAYVGGSVGDSCGSSARSLNATRFACAPKRRAEESRAEPGRKPRSSESPHGQNRPMGHPEETTKAKPKVGGSSRSASVDMRRTLRFTGAFFERGRGSVRNDDGGELGDGFSEEQIPHADSCAQERATGGIRDDR